MFKKSTAQRRLDRHKFRILIPLAMVSLKYKGVRFTCNLFCPDSRFSSNNKNDNIRNARQVLNSLKSAVSSTKFNGNCLSRSIVFKRVLQGYGISSEIKVGVAKKGPILKAHAWVEHKGIPLNSGAKVRQRYKTIEAYEMTESLEFA